MSLIKKKIHPNGPEMSHLIAGMMRLNDWNLTITQRIDFIEKCIDLGITTFDHADIYGAYTNEKLFGEALKERPDLRDQIEMISKCGICLTTENRAAHKIKHYDTTPDHINSSVEKSLQNLQTDYLDLLLIHRPDPLMDAAELADCLMNLISDGKILHIGVSNFTTAQYELLQSKLDVPLVTNQIEFSLLHLNPIYDGTFDQAQKLNFSPMIWSPFAGGRIFHEESGVAGRVRHHLEEMHQKYQADIDQIALAWLMTHPSNPLPVLGTGNVDRLKSAVSATEINLDRQDWFKLLKASRGHDVA
ncbi:aldo/keto reductase [Rhodohalobacter barkolensis]|uniref:Oxidoreductase n=1 Tax=Rhodohalobacter barkolensis TaxID=2053187 RepID=A0A2N0VHX8_9BACT|nr:aldo/keto reductase [Rhodohalobacter barkolensis]PKD43793.1 oxidoreductase [Rhodohalobacter barkolensis]